jgi:hypothetical protein
MSPARPDPELEGVEGVSAQDADVPTAATIPARAAFALGAFYLLLLLVAARLPSGGGPWVAALAVALFVYFPLAIIYHAVRIPLGSLSQVLGGLIALAVWLALVGLERAGDTAVLGPSRNVALLVTCLFFGMWASRIMRDRNILVPACLVAGAADLLSVGWGFTGKALQQAPGLVTKLSVAVPTLARETTAAGETFTIIATMGVGDLFFVALFFAAAARFGLPLRRTFCYVFPLVVGAMLLGLSPASPFPGIPGLPFIAIGFLLANRGEFRFNREEWQSTLVLGLILVGVAVAVVALTRQG